MGRLRGGEAWASRRWLAGLAMLSMLSMLAGCASGPGGRGPTAPPWAPGQSAQVVLTAMSFLDTPYRRGGTGGAGLGSGGALAADGFDCSGFTRHVYEHGLGLALPRTAWDQARAATLLEVAPGDLQPGDLVFFNTLQRPHSHVGIYIGQGRFIHAPKPGTSVRIEEMQAAAGRYWVQRYEGARRPARPGR